MATAPARNHGARKPTLEPAFPDHEVFADGGIERAICREQLIVDSRGGALLLQRGDMGVDLGAVFFLRVLGRNFDGIFGFHVDQQRRLFELGPDLL